MKFSYNTAASAATKIFKKSMRLHLQRVTDQDGRDFVYITDAFLLLKMPYVLYEIAFRPISPLYIELKPGDRASLDANSNKALPEVTPTGIDLADYWGKFGRNAAATVTPMKRELQEAHGDARIITYGAENNIMAIDEKYYAVIRELHHKTAQTAGRVSGVCFTDGEFEIDAVIMPVRLVKANNMYIDSFADLFVA